MTTRAYFHALGIAALLAACDGESESAAPTEQVVYLSSTDHLVRASMALRGTRPSLSDLAAVEADSGALPGIVDGYLESPRFGATMRDLYNDALLLQVDFAFFPAGFLPKPPIEDVDQYTLNRSIMDASLRLIEYVVMNDRPLGEIVTADYFLANRPVAAVWGLPYDPAQAGPDGWQMTGWTDGRGNAGILSDSWVFQRHSTTESNAHRGRANAISRALLCYDFLSRDIVVDASVNLADPNTVANAVQENEACATCHQALDPLASLLSGYFPVYVPSDITYPLAVYIEDLFEVYLGIDMREPAYFGQSGKGLQDLGAFIAEDPRFSLCQARRFYAYFHQIDVEAVPLDRASDLQLELEASGMSAKALARAVVLGDDFRISHALTEARAAEVVGVKRARPSQLATTMEDLTGATWKVDLTTLGLGIVDLTEDSFIGYRVLGGGTDSLYVTQAARTYNATSSLYLAAYAKQAAAHVVETDFAEADPTQRKLLGVVESDTSDEAAIRAQLAALHLRMYGETALADSDAITESFTLWKGAFDHGGDVPRAWKATLTAMLQDIRIAYY